MNQVEQLISNFNYVQEKINQIKRLDNIDIKQISDLQRYIEMQMNIFSTIVTAMEVNRHEG